MGWIALPLTVVSLAGVWSAVPDTEPALATGTALVPFAILVAFRAGQRKYLRVGPVSTVALALAVVGATWVGSAGWGSALVAVIAVGMVAIAPMVLGFGQDPLPLRPLALLGSIHIVVAVVVPRAVMRRSVPIAVSVGLATTVALIVVTALIGRRLRSER